MKIITYILFTNFLLTVNDFSQSHEEYFKQAEVLFDKNDYYNAITYYTLAIKEKPKIRYYTRRGLSFYATAQYQKAIEDFDESINRFDYSEPSVCFMYYWRGKCYYKLEDYEKALHDISGLGFQSCGEDDDSYQKLELLLKGWIYYKLNKIDEASSNFRNCIQQFPSCGEAYTGMGWVNYQNGSINLACWCFAKGKALGYKDAEVPIQDYCNYISYNDAELVILKKAEDFENQNLYSKAIDEYSNVIALNPYVDKGYLQRGMCYLKLEYYESAISDFTNYIVVSDNLDEKIYLKRSMCYIELSKYSEASEDLDIAYKINPYNCEIYYRRGNIIYAQTAKGWIKENKGFKDAIKEFTKAIELNSNYSAFYYNRGLCYYYLNEFDKACTDFRKAKEMGMNKADEFIKETCK
ncbi:MAG TPA: tetratricopeptide repeat protein [Ignavibacteria bacterium]|nr:tetratricopeptide repeat protein [Ignavibacteria bacterium]